MNILLSLDQFITSICDSPAQHIAQLATQGKEEDLTDDKIEATLKNAASWGLKKLTTDQISVPLIWPLDAIYKRSVLTMREIYLKLLEKDKQETIVDSIADQIIGIAKETFNTKAKNKEIIFSNFKKNELVEKIKDRIPNSNSSFTTGFRDRIIYEKILSSIFKFGLRFAIAGCSWYFIRPTSDYYIDTALKVGFMSLWGLVLAEDAKYRLKETEEPHPFKITIPKEARKSISEKLGKKLNVEQEQINDFEKKLTKTELKTDLDTAFVKEKKEPAKLKHKEIEQSFETLPQVPNLLNEEDLLTDAETFMEQRDQYEQESKKWHQLNVSFALPYLQYLSIGTQDRESENSRINTLGSLGKSCIALLQTEDKYQQAAIKQLSKIEELFKEKEDSEPEIELQPPKRTPQPSPKKILDSGSSNQAPRQISRTKPRLKKKEKTSEENIEQDNQPEERQKLSPSTKRSSSINLGSFEFKNESEAKDNSGKESEKSESEEES